MNIGYACITVGLKDTSMKKCLLRNVNDQLLLSTIEHNLNSLDKQIDYNINNNIKMFRISSDLIPFGSSKINGLDWQLIFKDSFSKIANKIKDNGMRVSMHPGQYTVLNSLTEITVENAINDLKYHVDVLDSLETDLSCKIILHVGGVYGDKEDAIKRFIDNYQLLPQPIKNRLVIENDDKSYNIKDVLAISALINIPVVYDNLHNALNPTDEHRSDSEWIHECSKTWAINDGKQKIHYSQSNPNKKSGSHSDTINIDEFLVFNKTIKDDIDIMLEVKDKNISAIKCINCLANRLNISMIEKEWSRYKYLVLSKSHTGYTKIRQLLKDFDNDKTLTFYHMIEHNLSLPDDIGNQVNAAQHVWGYFKNIATSKQKNQFTKLLQDYQDNKIDLTRVKNYLYKLTIEYQIQYLINSYYFYL